MWWNDSMISAAMRLLDYNLRDGVLDFKEWAGAFRFVRNGCGNLLCAWALSHTQASWCVSLHVVFP
jgi:hypothetical protein